MKKKFIIAWLLVILLLAGCGGNKPESAMKSAVYSDSYTNDMAYEEMAATMPEPAMAEGMAADGMYNDAGAGAADGVTQQTAPEYGGRKIIRTLSIDRLTGNFDNALPKVMQDVQTAGGFVQSSNVYGTKPEVAGDDGRHAYITLRIPADVVDAFINTASGYGEVQSQSEDTQDITDGYFDIETRLSVSRTTLDRLKSILVKTNNLSDIIALEQEIARVTTEIEQLTTNLRRYDGMIAYATVNISLQEEGLRVGPAAKTPFGQRVSDGFNETLSAVRNAVEDVAVYMLSRSPVLIPLAAIVAVILILDRKRPKRIAGETRSQYKAARHDRIRIT